MLSIIFSSIILPLLLITGLTLAFLLLIGFFRFDAPFIPIPAAVLPHIREALKLKPDSVLYDLGSGDGRVVAYCALSLPQGRAIGIEKGFIPFIVSKLRLVIQHRRNANILRRDLFEYDYGDATHVFAYLLPKMLVKLEPILQKQLKPGTRMVTADFTFPNRQPDQIIELHRPKSLGDKLYVYTF
jgi:hypothetical protein